MGGKTKQGYPQAQTTTSRYALVDTRGVDCLYDGGVFSDVTHLNGGLPKGE